MPGARSGERIWVTCAGRAWHLRSATAEDWIQAALSTDMSGVFPGLVADSDAAECFDLWFSVPDMHRRSLNVSRVALGRAARREWAWTYNLIQEVSRSWAYVNGPLVRQGVRADSTILPDWLDAAYTLLREFKDDKGRAALETTLSRTPQFAVAAGMTPKMSGRDDLLAFARP